MKHTFLITAASIVLALQNASLHAQEPVVFEFGVRAGVPFSAAAGYSATGPLELFGARYAFERSRFLAGPTIGVILYDRVGVEFDAIFKPIRYQVTSPFSPTSPTSRTTSSRRGSSWEFPLLANYRFLRGPVRPYGGGGIVLGQKLELFLYDKGPAFLINGGVEWKKHGVSVRPEFRYTHWPDTSQSGYFYRRSQFEYLIGVTFHPFTASSQ